VYKNVLYFARMMSCKLALVLVVVGILSYTQAANIPEGTAKSKEAVSRDNNWG
jgi:hypothetical protein